MGRILFAAKSLLGGNAHEQTVICWLFGGLLANEKKEKMHQMIFLKLYVVLYCRTSFILLPFILIVFF